MMRVIVGKASSKPALQESSGLLPPAGQTFTQQVSTLPEEIKWEAISMEELTSLASTSTLFGGARIFVLSGALAGERAEEFLDLAGAFVESEHTFVFEEEKLLKRETDMVTKAGAKVEKQEKEEKKERDFDSFGLTFALVARDKKKLWLSLMQAFRAGERAEAVSGLLAWKARQMEDKNLSREFTFMYHDSHRGVGNLELLLERFVLKL